MKATINPNITVETGPYSPLEDWVTARDEQQKLEKQIKKIKSQIKEFETPAQAEALAKLAEVNGLVDVEPTVYPMILADAKVKTFEFNPLFKIQVSFTTELIEDDEELIELRKALTTERETLAKTNKADIDVLLAEKALIESKIAKLQTNAKVEELSEKLDDLTQRLTLPVVKSLSLKKA